MITANAPPTNKICKKCSNAEEVCELCGAETNVYSIMYNQEGKDIGGLIEALRKGYFAKITKENLEIIKEPISNEFCRKCRLTNFGEIFVDCTSPCEEKLKRIEFDKLMT